MALVVLSRRNSLLELSASLAFVLQQQPYPIISFEYQVHLLRERQFVPYMFSVWIDGDKKVDAWSNIYI